ncbi:DUF3558 domain-containing protein [Amycolatopsis sp. NPDC048633]|uniref:DUF3558 domain-containing protein n=1 Tax=Amycolatopsis sp. NPDC048633 TaxID=3157095 RepID=UPI00340CE1EC
MRRSVVLLSASLLVLTACSDTKAGTATPVVTSSGSADTLPAPGVPKVETPVDTTRFKHTPCEALTKEEITTLLGSGATAREQLDAPGGPTCDWHPGGTTQAKVGVIFNKVNQAGLSGIYEKQGSTFRLFMPMDPVEGLPAVAYGLKDERTSSGRCAVAIGTSDQEMIDISITQSEVNVGKKDPCADAHEVAEKVVDNIKGAQ